MTNAPDVDALVNVTNMYRTWKGCSGLTAVPKLPASSTKLKVVAEAFMDIGGGMTGTVVELWNTNLFPNVTNYVNAFDGATSLNNWADIPASWK
jgi:hypothetical protein